jgi:hypothetical protein
LLQGREATRSPNLIFPSEKVAMLLRKAVVL